MTQQRLDQLYTALKNSFPSIDRIALARYDSHDGMVIGTYQTNPGNQAYPAVSAKLEDTVSLRSIAESRSSRIVHDMRSTYNDRSDHVHWLFTAGFQSSMTIPVFEQDDLLGFVFFNSKELGYFNMAVQQSLSRELHLFADMMRKK